MTELILTMLGIVRFAFIPCVLTYLLFKIPGFNEAFEKFFQLNVED